MSRLIELSHVIRDGMPGYPGLPAPSVGEFLTHESSRPHYDGAAEFSIVRLELVGNTGTYIDSPFHRFPNRADLSEITLERLVDVDAVVVDAPEAAGPVDVELDGISGRAVLFRSGWDRRWGRDDYWDAGPFLGPATVRSLVAGRAALVGVDFWNVDDTRDLARPVHTRLLDAGILIVEHLTRLRVLPRDGFRFSAVPLSVAGAASLPVRAWATLPD